MTAGAMLARGFVEQDEPKDEFANIRASFNYLHELRF
jgi:hypothetical protein